MIDADSFRQQANLLNRSVHAELSVQCHSKRIKAILILIVIASLLRIFFAGIVGLGVDESYTVGVARQFSLSYFDHPPLHIWIIGTWSSLWGSENALLLRLPFIALFAGSTWLLFLMTRRLFDERAGIWAAFAFNLAPFFTLSTGSWMIPDGALIFFLLGSANVLTRLLFNQECEKPLLHWIWAGALAGLGLLSKYIGIFFVLSIFFFLVTSPTKRHWLATPGPWLGALLAGILFLPVVIWNIDHNWASFAFQGGRAMPREFNLNYVLQYLGGQFLYLLPWIFLSLSWCLGKAIAKGPSQSAYWFLACLAFLPVAFFSLIALWTRVLPHWPSSGWLFMFPLLGKVIAQYESVHRRLIWVFGMGAVLFDVVMFTLLGVHASTGFLVRVAPEKLNRAFVKELLNWSELKAELTQRGLLQEKTFIAGLNWINSGKLNYALGRKANVLCLSQEPHQFGVDNVLSSWLGTNGIIVGTREQITAAMSMLGSSFEHIELLAPVTLRHCDTPALELNLIRGTGFKPGQISNKTINSK
jgi:dolichyl-phosphate-mannose-protein mannosyltransferase